MSGYFLHMAFQGRRYQKFISWYQLYGVYLSELRELVLSGRFFPDAYVSLLGLTACSLNDAVS